MSANGTRRIALLDEIRGFCVFCMIFYHLFALMDDPFGFSVGTRAFYFLMPAEPWFAATFILICGISCRLSHSNWLRGAKLLGVALLFSLVSILVLPLLGLEDLEDWFGILHLLSVSILLFALLDRPLTRIPAPVGIVLSALLFFLFRNWIDGSVGLFGSLVWTRPDAWNQIPWLFPLGITTPQFYSADYFPLIPYTFLFLAGTYLGIYVRDGKIPEFAYPKRVPLMDWFGRHALIIYIVHVPILLVILTLIQHI